MSEDHLETEPAPDPVPEVATEGVTLDQLAEQLRLLAHDVTVLMGLVPTVAHAQTSILDQITALNVALARLEGREDEQTLLDEFRGLGRLLVGFNDRMAAIEDHIERR
jgi:hypothetical protein